MEMTGARRARNVRPRRLGAVTGLGIFVLVLLLAAGSGSTQSTPPATPSVSDWDIFARKGCARCHRVRGIGDGRVGPDLGRIDSGTGFVEIAAAMWNHVAEMRAQMRKHGVEWPRFTPQEFSKLIEFLFTAQLHDIARDPVEGRRVFAAKGCDRCHSTSDTGAPAAPRLAELRRSTSSLLMAAAMWNHVAGMGDAMEAAGVTSPFAGTELQDVVAYIRTAGPDSRGASAPLLVGVPDRGRRLFVVKGCAGCHAVEDKGSSSGPRMGPRAPRATVTDLPVVLWNHRVAVRTLRLPALTGQDMADVTAYLHASYYFDPPQGDLPRGRRLLEDKGCLVCHSIYGSGGSSAPDFAASNVVSSKLGQLTAMWNHGPYMENEAKRRAMTLPVLTGQELSDITTYLAALGSGPRPR
jgi:mono/diheme cytochrome c family protein